MRALTRLTRDERAVAALEFALILPVLLMMVAGLVEYGRVLFVEQAVRNIIDDAARRAVITSLTGDAVETEVEASLENVRGIQEYTVDVDDGTELSVAVSGTFNLFFGAFLPETMIAFELTTQFPR